MNMVSSLQGGIYEGICSVCPWNGKLIEGRICARTAVSTLIDLETIRGDSLPDTNFEGAREEFAQKAEVCAWTLLREALQEQPKPLEPTETFDKHGIAAAILRHRVSE